MDYSPYRAVRLRNGQIGIAAPMAPTMCVEPYILGGYIAFGEHVTEAGEPQMWQQDGSWREDHEPHELDILGFAEIPQEAGFRA